MAAYFANLNYSLGDEDTQLETALLPEDARHVLAIAGSGGRILPLLAKAPRKLTCVDISPPQLAFTRLRLALLAHVDVDEFIEFLGYRKGMSPANRKAIFERLVLPAPDRELLAGMFDSTGWKAPIYSGGFERTLIQLARVVRLFTGKAGQGIFLQDDLQAQREYYRTRFPHRRWRVVLALLGNSAVLNSLLYKGSFPRNNLGITAFARYQQIFHRLFTAIPARRSFFLQMVFFGELRYEEGFPVECHADVYARAKRALAHCEVDVVQGDILDCAAARAPLDFVSISDVPSFMPDPVAQAALQRLRTSLLDHAMVVTRGHMRVVRPQTDGFEELSDRYAEAIAQETTQLWQVHVYRKERARASGAVQSCRPGVELA